jgi:hypothetical protein
MSKLSFDGKGINGPDAHRSRVATFTSEEAAHTYGALFAAAPELLEALAALLDSPWLSRTHDADGVRAAACAALRNARGEA